MGKGEREVSNNDLGYGEVIDPKAFERFKDRGVPLTLNFGRRIGAARILRIDDKGITVVCEVSPELKELVKIIGDSCIGQISFALQPATPEGNEGEEST